MNLVNDDQQTSTGRGDADTILLVEDDVALRQLFARVLRNAGYGVLEAANGEEALATASDVCISLLVTDIVMPEMGGIELARRMCEADSHLQVIYMSGYPEAVIKKQGSLNGGASWMMKPFGPGALLHAVRAQLPVAGARPTDARNS